MAQKASKKFHDFDENDEDEERQILNLTNLIHSNSQTFDLLQSAADILNASQTSSNDTYQYDAELIELINDDEEVNQVHDNKLYLIETSTPTDDHLIINNFCLNDYVSISGKKCGFIKYIGKVHFANGLFYGIELDEAEGKHNGQIDQVR